MQRTSARWRHRRCDSGRPVDHWRGQHHAAEPAAAPRRRLEQHRRSHGMAEREIGRGTIRQHHALHEMGEILFVFGEIADMALELASDEPARSALSAPIEDRDGEAAPSQLAHHLEIFLDELVATGKDADRAAPILERRAPTRIAQAQALADVEIARLGAERDRVLRCRDESHWCAFGLYQPRVSTRSRFL